MICRYSNIFGMSLRWDVTSIKGFRMIVTQILVSQKVSCIHKVTYLMAPSVGHPAQSWIHIGRPLRHRVPLETFIIQ